MSPHVVVVGGGVLGWSIAWRLAGRGATVTLVDPQPSRGSSWVAAGMLAPVAEAHRGEEALGALCLASASSWPAFAGALAATGHDPGYEVNGTLIVARDGDDLGVLADLLALQHAAGLDSVRVGSREARRLEPALAPSVRGALWLPGDHQVDNRRLLAALQAAATDAGVGLCAERAASVAGDRIVTDTGRVVSGDAVVLATGARVPPVVVDGMEVAVPVRPVKGQILRLRAHDRAVFPTRTVRGLDVYVVPRAGGELVVGATVEEAGYDTTVTAGAVHDLLRDAIDLVPAVAEAELVEAVAGLRPGTPDNGPVLGRAGGIGGPILALGAYRHGVLLAPAIADLVVDVLLGGGDPALTALGLPFRPDRFGPAPANLPSEPAARPDVEVLI